MHSHQEDDDRHGDIEGEKQIQQHRRNGNHHHHEYRHGGNPHQYIGIAGDEGEPVEGLFTFGEFHECCGRSLGSIRVCIGNSTIHA